MQTTATLPLLIILIGGVDQAAAGPAKAEDDWHYSLAPLFLWGISIDGSATIGRATAPLDLSFKDDVFENIDAVYTFHFEARKQDWTIFAEYQYVNLKPGAALPNGSSVNVDFENSMAELGTMYRVARYDRTDVDVLGGLRYVNQDIRVTGVPLPPVSTISADEDWVDAMFGGRVRSRISSNWQFVGRADYSVGGSDGTCNLSGLFDYRFNDWGSLFFGYRWMDFDYSNGSGANFYAYEATQQGPLAGLNIRW